MTTTATLTARQINALRAEAEAAGDTRMASTCTRALNGSERARRVVAKAIRAAEAMAD